MKKYIIMAAAALMSAACTNLDEEIYSSVSKDDFFTSEEQLMRYSARAYTSLQAWGSEQSLWTMNIQLSDECAVPRNASGAWSEVRYGELQTHRILPSNNLVNQAWDFCFDGIAACNDVIFEIEDSELEFDGKDRVLAEMKVLRAFFYFCAIDCWGNVPYSISKEETGYPEQKDRKFMFEFIEREIKENIDFLAENPTTEYYGRVTRGVANTILAKLYLNAETWIGTPMWSEAESVCKEIIDSGFWSIGDDYASNFSTANEGSSEAIFAIPYSTVYTTSDHNAFIIYILTLSPALCDAHNIPADGWDGFVGQPDFLSTYEDRDIRKEATWMYGQQYDMNGNAIDSYVIEPDFPESDYKDGRDELEGARIGKWQYQTDGLLSSDQTSMDNDFFIFRYADVVLMYVEALVRQNRASEAAEVEDFKKIRERAGLEPMSAGELTLDNLLLERGHELALEGWKRQDLIRFGKYSRTWWAKPDETPEYALLLPIPSDILNANPNLDQNPGY